MVSKAQQESIAQLVDKIYSLNKQLQEFGDKQTSETSKIKEEIIKTDTEIDNLIYKLYEINPKDQKVIEESLK